jgi:hypothetical protein
MSDSIKRQTKIINDIIRERTSQDQQWGGATHDDGHTVEDWYSFRSKFESRALFGARKPERMKEGQDVRGSLIKIAALAVAQLESLDRKAGL